MKKLLLLASFIFCSVLIGADPEVSTGSSGGSDGSVRYQNMSGHEAVKAYLKFYGQPEPYDFDPDLYDQYSREHYERHGTQDRIEKWRTQVDHPEKASFPQIDIQDEPELRRLKFPHPINFILKDTFVKRVGGDLLQYKEDHNALQSRWNRLHTDIAATLPVVTRLTDKPFNEWAEADQQYRSQIESGFFSNGILEGMLELEQLQKFARKKGWELDRDHAGEWLANLTAYREESPHAHIFDSFDEQLMDKTEKETTRRLKTGAEKLEIVRSLDTDIDVLEKKLEALSKRWWFLKNETLKAQKQKELDDLRSARRVLATPEEELSGLTQENLLKLAK